MPGVACDGGEYGQAEREAVQGAARRPQHGQRSLTQVCLGSEAVAEHAVGAAARRGRHPLANRSEEDSRIAMRIRTWVEEVRHERVLVELAAEGQLLAGSPAMPDRPERADELLHPRGRVTPRHGEPALDVRPDLRAEAELEPAAGYELDVVCQHGHVHGVTRERDGDTGLQRDGRSRARGERERDKGIVSGLGDAESVVTVGLGGHSGGLDVSRSIGDVGGGVDQHAWPFRRLRRGGPDTVRG